MISPFFWWLSLKHRQVTPPPSHTGTHARPHCWQDGVPAQSHVGLSLPRCWLAGMAAAAARQWAWAALLAGEHLAPLVHCCKDGNAEHSQGSRSCPAQALPTGMAQDVPTPAPPGAHSVRAKGVEVRALLDCCWSGLSAAAPVRPPALPAAASQATAPGFALPKGNSSGRKEMQMSPGSAVPARGVQSPAVWQQGEREHYGKPPTALDRVQSRWQNKQHQDFCFT